MSHYDYTFKILLLGDASVGKTSFTKRYCYNIFNPSERLTIGVDFHVKTIELNDTKIRTATAPMLPSCMSFCFIIFTYPGYVPVPMCAQRAEPKYSIFSPETSIAIPVKPITPI